MLLNQVEISVTMTPTTDTSLSRHLNTLDGRNLIGLLKNSFADRVSLYVESSFPVTQSAFEKLTAGDIEKIEEAVAVEFGGEVLAQIQKWKELNRPHYRREILRYGCSVAAALLEQKTGMTNACPPSHIHSMIRQNVFAGDLYHGDMVCAAALRGGVHFAEAHNYLDFGCSSGALVRNMAAEFRAAHWYACDPVAESVAWASRHFPHIQFVNSNQVPPLQYPDNYFDGVYAISIWSHFSELAALKWFHELHRIIKSNGFLIFTVHGYRSVLYYLERLMFSPEILSTILGQLISHGHAFHPVWQEPEQEYGLNVKDWGMAYFNVEWLIRNLLPNFSIVDFRPGLCQINQDVYVLKRI